MPHRDRDLDQLTGERVVDQHDPPVAPTRQRSTARHQPLGPDDHEPTHFAVLDHCRSVRWEPMMQELTDLPAGVIGFEATGKLRAEDYRDVLLPAIERAASGDLRIVIVISDFDGLTGGALWQDLKMGIEHMRGWKRIALVTDIEWMIHMTSMFGWMTPGEVEHFALAERDAAIAWAAG